MSVFIRAVVPAAFKPALLLATVVAIGACGGPVEPEIKDPAKVTATPARFTLEEDAALGGKLEATDAAGGSLSFTVLTPPKRGSLELQPDGNFTFVPNANFFGEDRFVFEASSSANSLRGSAEVTLTITPVNDAPVVQGAVPTFTIAEDTALSLSAGNLLVTDVDDAHEALTVEVLAGANFTWAGWLFIPAPEFSGLLSVEAIVSDGEASVTQSFQVNVTPINDAPRIIEQARAINSVEDTPFAIVLEDVHAEDVDSPIGALTIEVLEGPNYTRVGNTVAPAQDFSGQLLVRVAVSDGESSSAPHSLVVEVLEGNDPPAILAQARALSMAEDTSLTLTVDDLVVMDPDQPVSTLTFEVLDGVGYTRLGNTVTPPPEFNGPLSVPVVVSDGEFTTAPFTLTIEVTPVDDPPQLLAQAGPLTTAEDTALTLTLAAVTASDVDSPTLTLVVQPGANYSVMGTTVTPALNFHGELEVPVTVSDGNSESAALSFLLTVTPVNDAPVIASQSRALSTSEDTAIELLVTDVVVNDVDDSAWTLTALAGTNYSLSGNTVTPAPDFNGTLRVPVTVSDGDADSASFELTVTVGAVNDVPVITGQARAVTTPEDTSYTVVLADLTVVDADHPDSALSVSLQAGANYSVSGATLTPAANYNGPLSVPVTVSDGEESSTAFLLTVTVSAVNDVPVISAQLPLTTDEDVPLTLTLADFTVTDPDDTVFTLTVGPGANYTVVNATVTPAAEYFGPLDVAVTVNDGTASSSAFVARINVIEVNDPPVAQPESFSTSANTELVVNVAQTVLANDSDKESAIVFVSAAPLSANGSNVVVASDGSFVYRPKAGFTGTDTFTYTVKETVGTQTAVGTVTVTVDGPVIWYVNNAGAAGDGRSHSPFQTLAAAQAASAADQVIFVYRGSGGTYDPVTLKDGQSLVGEGAGLTRVHNAAIPAGLKPVLGAGGAWAVQLAKDNQLRGFNVNATQGGISGSNVGNLKILGVLITSVKDGLVLSGGTDTPTLQGITVHSTGGRGLVASNFTSLLLADSGITLNAGDGAALELTNVDGLQATLPWLQSASSPNLGVRLDDVSGSLTVLERVTVTTPATEGMLVKNSNLTLTVPKLDVSGGTRGLSVESFSGTFTLGPASGIAGTGGTIKQQSGEGLYLQDVSGLSVRRMRVEDTGGDGLRIPDGGKVTGLSLTDSYFLRTGNASGEFALNFGRSNSGGRGQLEGTVLVKNIALEALGGGGVLLDNGGGTLNLTLDGLSVQGTGATSPGVLIRSDARFGSSPAPQLTLTVKASSFTGIPAGANGLDVATEGGAAQLTATLEDNLFHNTVGQGNTAIRLSADGANAALTAFVRRNSVRNWNGHAILAQTGDQGASLLATIENNTVGVVNNAGTVGSVNGAGIRVLLDADPGTTASSARVLLANNGIGKTGAQGIQVVARQGTAALTHRLDVTLTSNTITHPVFDAVHAEVSEGSTVCLAASGNQLSAPSGYFGFYARAVFPAAFLVAGAPSPSAPVIQSHLSSTNNAATALASGAFQAAPSCLTP